MGKKWDYDVPSEEVWRECLRVLKPGGHLLAFAGTRTQHRMAVRIEDAGFEIRDMIAWVYGSGFPKSLNIGKAIDKLQGNEREVVGEGKGRTGERAQPNAGSLHSDDNYQWPGQFEITKGTSPHEGWGTALKPALEPITVARKPLIGTVAENVLEWGTGGINVDGCRVGTEQVQTTAHKTLGDGIKYGKSKPFEASELRTGRFPANLIHDGSEEVVGLFPSPHGAGKANTLVGNKTMGTIFQNSNDVTRFGDSGSAARFFYCAKSSKRDRGDGNNHPTVKPTDLMRYLCRLVTPPGGTVLDPFMGSGSTGKAAILEGFHFIGIEQDTDYVEIARARIKAIQSTLQVA
jgi:site-specific DNA-methyltransferase (adenine-specific)